MPTEEGQSEVRRGEGRSRRPENDVPEAIRRRYLTEGDQTIRYYTDASVKAPSFIDHGGRLTSEGNDPRALQDMARIAHHRGWTKVQVRGSETFRRTAWAALSREGLEVEGHGPAERELQALERLPGQHRTDSGPDPTYHSPSDRQTRARQHLALLQALTSTRIKNVERREEIMTKVRDRLDAWIERDAERQARSQPRRFYKAEREKAR